jgi:hypothetical protein
LGPAPGRQRWWRPAVFGTLVAAGLAGLVIAPHFISVAPRAPAPGKPLAQETRPGVPPPALDEAAYNDADEHRPAPSAAPASPVSARAVQRSVADSGGSPASPPQALTRTSAPRVSTAPSGAPQAGAEGSADPAAAFRRAAEVGDLALLDALLGKHVDINSRDPLGRTALMLATQHGRAEVVASLLAHGADPNVPDARGTTPLQAATASEETAIVATLQRYGAR